MATHKLHGKHIVIIGGASGIGLETARQALSAGASVTIGDASAPKLSKALQTLSAEGLEPSPSSGLIDVDDESSVTSFFSNPDFLPPTIDHLFITAGKLDRGNSSALHADPAVLRSVLLTRLMGPTFCLRAARHRLAPDGSVLLVSGLDAVRPGPESSFAAASTEGVVGLTRALALDLKPVRVNCLMPGLIDTPLWEDVGNFEEMADAFTEKLPVPRRGTAADVAEGALFLFGNGYSTGSTVHIDGGARLV